MRLSEISFFCDDNPEDRLQTRVTIDKEDKKWPVTIRIWGNDYGRGEVAFYCSEQDLITLKNDFHFAVEAMRRKRHENE